MKNNVIKNITNKTLGILGGGQLGKMIAVEASRFGICLLYTSDAADE